MEWIKVSDQFPHNGEVLYFDGELISLLNSHDGKLRSSGYDCNNDKCSWVYDDCCCDFVVKNDHYWMPLPNQPERLSEKTSKEDAIV